MNPENISRSNPLLPRPLIASAFLVGLVFLAPVPAYAQSPDDSTRTEAATAVPARIERARALAAAHQLAAAASELESLRATVADEVVRTVTSVMLMNIYLEEGNYARAEALLDETFRSRAAEKDRSIRTYFALAGQAVNGARSHLARYRSFGLNILDAALPSEAVNDLERLRSLLERMIAQAKEISTGESRAYDSLALLEDVLGIRLSLARDSEDRERWENEYAVARQGLASRRQIASLRGMPPQPSTIRSSSPASVVSSGSSGPRLETPAANTADRSRSSGEGQPSPGGDVSAASAERNGQPAGVVLESEGAVEPATLNTGMLNSRATKQVPASYPQTARSAGVEGVVKVYVSVDENGKVKGVFKSDGPPLLKSTAEAAARQWKFPPTLVDGKPARLVGYIEFSFTTASP